MRLLLCEWAGLLLSNLVVPYETTRITGAAMVYIGFVLRGASFNFLRSIIQVCMYVCVYGIKGVDLRERAMQVQ